MRLHKSVVIALLLVFAVPNLNSQSTISGLVTGLVTDPSKSAVGNAAVRPKSTDTSVASNSTHIS
jgi:hypothetical protein